MAFSETIRRHLDGEAVRCARLTEFQFRSGTQRFWPGEWNLTTTDGQRWRPTMGLGAVTGLRQSYNGSAPELRFELSGVDAEFIRRAKAAREEYEGRKARLFWQFFGADWQPLDLPFGITWGYMRNLESRRQSEPDGTLRTIILTAETPFDGRGYAPNGMLTDTDQKRRHPGDRMLERIAGIEAKLIRFPDF